MSFLCAFRFSLKEIGNLLGRLAILTNEGFVQSCVLKAATDRRTSGIPKRFVATRGQSPTTRTVHVG